MKNNLKDHPQIKILSEE